MYHNHDVVTDFAWRSCVVLVCCLTAPLNSPQRVADLPDRLHTITVAGKILTRFFYSKPYTKSFFLGCSLGGRQGIKAAEMFPSDFDGIVAGSPALDFNNLQSWRARFFPITGRPNSSDYISTARWINLIHGEILNQCDGLDGAIDGIIEDPNLCSFRPEALLCRRKTTADCLTSNQVEMVREIFSPFYGENGNLIYPAMQPGSEIMAATNLYAGKPFSYSEVTILPKGFLSALANITLFRVGSSTLFTIQHGMQPPSTSTMPPLPRRSILQISEPGPTAFRRSNTEAGR